MIDYCYSGKISVTEESIELMDETERAAAQDDSSGWPMNPLLFCPTQPCTEEIIRQPGRFRNLLLEMNTYCDATSYPWYEPNKELTTISQACTLYFRHAATAMHEALAGDRLRIVMRQNDINALLDELRLGGAAPFDRIALSNIPDFTGYLNTVVCCTPLLAERPSSLMGSNVLVNCQLFRSMAHILHSSLGCMPTIVMFERLLGCTYLTGDHWADIAFRRTPRIIAARPLEEERKADAKRENDDLVLASLADVARRPSDAVFRAFLLDMFVLCALPPRTTGPGDPAPGGAQRKFFSMNLCSWVQLACHLCQHNGAVPPHVVALAVDEVLSGKFTAPLHVIMERPNVRAAARHLQDLKEMTVHTNLFLLEVRTILGYRHSSLPFPIFRPSEVG